MFLQSIYGIFTRACNLNFISCLIKFVGFWVKLWLIGSWIKNFILYSKENCTCGKFIFCIFTVFKVQYIKPLAQAKPVFFQIWGLFFRVFFSNALCDLQRAIFHLFLCTNSWSVVFSNILWKLKNGFKKGCECEPESKPKPKPWQ